MDCTSSSDNSTCADWHTPATLDTSSTSAGRLTSTANTCSRRSSSRPNTSSPSTRTSSSAIARTAFFSHKPPHSVNRPPRSTASTRWQYAAHTSTCTAARASSVVSSPQASRAMEGKAMGSRTAAS